MVFVREVSIEIEKESAKYRNTFGVDKKMAGHQG